MSLCRGDPPASRARPTPPAFGRSGLCRPRRGVVLGVSCAGGWGWRTELRNRASQPQKQSRGSPAPCPTCREGRAQAAAGLFGSRRRAARLPGSSRRRLGLRAGNASARAPSGGRRGHCGGASRRSFSRPSQPFACKPGVSRACPHPNLFPSRTEPPSHRGCNRIGNKGFGRRWGGGALQPHSKEGLGS